eukprot:m.597047 g.597047  ORF g.597047 m.597047 type:complete len:77 (+) comp58061_c0_seq10:1024-1254(+)
MAAHVFSSVLFKENAIDILMFVDEMPELRAICMGFLSRNPSTLLATPGRAGVACVRAVYKGARSLVTRMFGRPGRK